MLNDDESRLGGYLVVFGDTKQRDLDGEYFTSETEFNLDWFSERPALFHHGQKSRRVDAIKSAIGKIDKIEPDDVGLWAEAVLDERNEYVGQVKKLVQRGALNWSSGAVSHLSDVAPDGRIKRWTIVEGSLTPTPAEPRMTDITMIKSVYDAMGLDSNKFIDGQETDARATAKATVTTDDDNVNDSQNKVKTMTDETQNTQDAPENAQTAPSLDANSIKGIIADEIANAFKAQREAQSDEQPHVKSGIATKATKPVAGAVDDDSDGMKAFKSYLKSGRVNSGLKALEGGTDSEGGYLVPHDFLGRIVERRNELSVVDQVPNFFRLTTTSDTYDIPVENNSASALTETAEEAAYNQTDPAFANKQGALTKVTRRIIVSEELLRDQSAALETFLQNRAAREFALARNSMLATELGANGTAALTLDANTTIAASEIPEIIGKQPEFYLDGSMWLMRWATENIIRSLQGNDFLFAPTPAGNALGMQRDLWGFPIYNSGQVEAIGSENKPIHFFNPEFVAVIDNQNLTLLRDPYTNAANGQVNFYFKARFEVVVLQAEAVQVIAMPT